MPALVVAFLAALTDPFVDAAVVIVMIGIGLVLAFVIVPPLVNIIRQIPVVGGSIATIIEGEFVAAQQTVNDWVNKNVAPLANAIGNPVAAFWQWIDGLQTLSGSIVAALALIAQTAAGAGGGVARKIAQLITTVAAQATSIGNIQTSLGDLVNNFAHAISATIPDAIAAAVQFVTTAWKAGVAAEHALESAAIATVTTYAQTLFATAGTALKLGLSDMTKYVDATATALVGDIDALEAEAKSYTDGAIKGVETEITDLNVPALALAIAGVIPLVGTLEATLTQTIDECVNPTCSTLGNGLGLFNTLAAGVELLAVVELVKSATSNPSGAGRDLAAGVGDLIGLGRPVLEAMGISV